MSLREGHKTRELPFPRMIVTGRAGAHAFIDELLSAKAHNRPYDEERAKLLIRHYVRMDRGGKRP